MNPAAFRAAEGEMWASVGLAPTERVVGGVRMQEVGEGSPVVLVHGASNSGVSWATLVRDLAPSHRCIVVDRPGCGLSAPLSRPFTDVDDLRSFAATFVTDLLDALGIERAHLIATSYGGLIALHSAAAAPDRIERLVLFGWSMGGPTRTMPFVMRLTSLRPIGKLMAAMPVNERMVRPLMKRIGVPNPSDAIVRTFTALLRHTPTMRNELDAGPAIMNLRGLNETILIPDETLASITTPTLLLWGSEDPLGGAEAARTLAARIPGATLDLLDGAGHAPWLDEPERCAAAVVSFLAVAGRAG